MLPCLDGEIKLYIKRRDKNRRCGIGLGKIRGLSLNGPARVEAPFITITDCPFRGCEMAFVTKTLASTISAAVWLVNEEERATFT